MLCQPDATVGMVMAVFSREARALRVAAPAIRGAPPIHLPVQRWSLCTVRPMQARIT